MPEMTSRSRTTATVLIGIYMLLMTLFLRYLWSLSLANGDELFFSTARGSFPIGEGTARQWADFLSWLWWEHTGRTADWLSAAIYFGGASSGKWLSSFISAACSATVALSLGHLGAFYAKRKVLTPPLFLLGTTSIILAPGVDTLNALANYTMYSAAVINYLVPVTLIILALRVYLTSHAQWRASIAGLLAGVSATMHEQAAATVIVLCLLALAIRPATTSLRQRVTFAALGLAGSVEMFLAPGLHNKLARAAVNVASPGPSLPQRLATVLYAFGAYFPLTAVMITAAALALFTYRMRQSSRGWPTVTIIVVTILATALWFFAARWQYTQIGTTEFSPTVKIFLILAGTLMMVSWVVLPLLGAETHVGSGALFTACAAASFTIPAAAGLSAVRVFTYPVLFGLCLILWAIMVPRAHHAESGGGPDRAASSLRLATATLLGFSTVTAAVNLFLSLNANFQPGLEALHTQRAECQEEKCAAQELNNLPYPAIFSGYGDHLYCDVSGVLEWMGHSER